MKIGYIKRNNLELNPQLTEKFTFIECNYTRKITSRSDRIFTKRFYPFDYDEVNMNTEIMEENNGLMLVGEPFFLDDALREKAVKWVEWANKADPKDYDFFA